MQKIEVKECNVPHSIKKRISRPINKSNRKLNIMKNKIIILLSTLTFSTTIFAQTWIWYPGDYEIWLGNKMNNRRTERGAFSHHSGKQTVIL